MDLPQHIIAGRALVEELQATRAALRKSYKPGTAERERRLDSALRRIDDAMRPIRSDVGAIAWGRDEFADELREVSAALQYERKQLKKMRRRSVTTA